MKICFMLGGFKANGGIGRVTSMLANKISEEDYGIEVFTLSYVKDTRPDLYSISNKVKQLYFLDSMNNMAKAMLKGGVKKLKKILRDNDIDVLIACGALFFPICVLACKGTRTKVICWEHTNPYHGTDYKFQLQMRKFGIKRSDLNVVLTKETARVYNQEFKVKNVLHIYNPIDEQIFDSSVNYNVKSKKIISVGRLSYPKYFEMAVEVAKEVLPQNPEWSWDIYGSGELEEKILNLIKETGLEGRMNLMGQVNDLYDRYKNYSFMVMTSRYEGFPMTLLEGMGNGLPLVSFNIKTGPNEIINNGENGFLIPAFDKKKMVNSINRLISDSELREKMSKKNIELRNMFSEKNIVDSWIDVLKNMA